MFYIMTDLILTQLRSWHAFG